MTQTIRGEVGLIGRRNIRKFLKKQKEVMYLLDISIQEKWGLFSSLFTIEVTGNETMVKYWSNVVKLYLNKI